MTQRRPLFAANWKMNLRRADAEAYADRLRREPAAIAAARATSSCFRRSPSCRWSRSGSTGRRSPGAARTSIPRSRRAHRRRLGAPLDGLGRDWVLCGHSERRPDHGESDELVAAKVAQAQRRGLTPCSASARPRDEREAERTETVLRAPARSGAAASRRRALGPRLRAGLGDRHRRTATPESGPGGPRPAAGGSGGAPGRRRRRARCGSSTAARSRPTTPPSCSPSPTSTASWSAGPALTRLVPRYHPAFGTRSRRRRRRTRSAGIRHPRRSS